MYISQRLKAALIIGFLFGILIGIMVGYIMAIKGIIRIATEVINTDPNKLKKAFELWELYGGRI